MNITCLKDQLSRFISIYNKFKYQYSEFKIIKLENRQITHIPWETNTDIIYSFPIFDGEYNYESAVLIVNSGDETSWQHFVQDAVHLFTDEVISLLNSDKSIPILIDSNPIQLWFIREVFLLQNPIYPRLNKKIKNLYIPSLLPHSRFIDSIVPYRYRNSIRLKIQNKLEVYKKKKLLYLSRDNRQRNCLNSNELRIMLEKYAEEKNLEFVNFISEEINDITKRFEIFYNADIIIAPHGGSIFHIYACRENTILVEFISTNGTPICDVGKLAPYLNLDYRVILTEGSHNGPGYTVNCDDIKQILNLEKTSTVIQKGEYFNDF
jgi:hypothetical protein